MRPNSEALQGQQFRATSKELFVTDVGYTKPFQGPTVQVRVNSVQYESLEGGESRRSNSRPRSKLDELYNATVVAQQNDNNNKQFYDPLLQPEKRYEAPKFGGFTNGGLNREIMRQNSRTLGGFQQTDQVMQASLASNEQRWIEGSRYGTVTDPGSINPFDYRKVEFVPKPPRPIEKYF